MFINAPKIVLSSIVGISVKTGLKYSMQVIIEIYELNQLFHKAKRKF